MVLILAPSISCNGPPFEEPKRALIQPQPKAARAAELLLRALGGSPSKSTSPARELAALGSDVGPFLLQVLKQRGIPVGADPERQHAVEITPQVEDIVLEALAKLPREPLMGLLRAASTSTDVRERQTALRVVGKVGTSEHLDLIGSLAAPLATDGLVPPATRNGFQEALLLVLARDPKTLPRLPDLYSRVAPALVLPLIRAIGRKPSLQAIDVLADLLGARPDADLLLLTELTHAAEAVDMPPAKTVAAQVRRHLAGNDSRVLQAAASAAGMLEDGEAVPELIRILSDADEQTSRSARASLKRIARKDLGKRPEDWTKWYEAESAWWERKSEAVARDLRGKDSARAAAAVLDLGRRRLRRHDAALLLTEGLLRPEPDIVRTVCQALGHLRSKVAAAALEGVKDHQDEKVRQAADDALARILEDSKDKKPVGAAQASG